MSQAYDLAGIPTCRRSIRSPDRSAVIMRGPERLAVQLTRNRASRIGRLGLLSGVAEATNDGIEGIVDVDFRRDLHVLLPIRS